MGLYDNYQLANSTQIKQFQGSTVPELVQVSNELQRRYDTVQDTNDYMSRYLSSLSALDQDKQQFKNWYSGYKQKITDLSKRPDLENAVREVTMLARNVPDEYQAAFGQRVQDREKYRAELEKEYESGKLLSRDKIQRLLAYSDAMDRGIQTDPVTGRQIGRYQGIGAVKDIDINKFVDEAMKNVDPQKLGWETEYIGDEWMKKVGGTTEKLTPQDIQNVLRAAMNSSTEWKEWVKQEQQLGTFDKDYSKLDFADLGMYDEVGQRFKIGENGKPVIEAGKPVMEAVTRGQLLQPYMEKGLSPAQALIALQQDQIEQQHMSAAMNYGMKYVKDNRTSKLDYSVNPYELQLRGKKLDDFNIPIAADILQPKAGPGYSTPAELNSKIEELDNANRLQYEQYNAWARKTDAKPTSGDIYNPQTKWFDATGKNVTTEARKFLDAQQQAAKASQELEARKKQIAEDVGYKITKDMEQKAQDEYDRTKAYFTEYNNSGTINSINSASTGAKTYTSAEIEDLAQKAYDKKLEEHPRYEVYKKALEDNNTSVFAPVGLSTFSSKNLNTAIEDYFNGLNLNLADGKRGKGATGMWWAAGKNIGEQLSDEDYKKVIGKGKFIGAGIDTDGEYKMFFKVGTAEAKDGKLKGEDIIVKTSAFSGLAQQFVAEKQIGALEQYIAQDLGRTGEYNLNLGNQKIQIKSVLPSERAALRTNPDTEYVVIFDDGKGGTSQEPATSRSQAVNIVTETLAAAERRANKSK